jgi:hypothetical protein
VRPAEAGKHDTHHQTKGAAVPDKDTPTAPEGATLTLTLSGSPDAVLLAQRVLMLISRLGHYGCSRDVVIPIDGDGHVRLDVDGLTIPPFRRSAMERATNKRHPRLGDFLGRGDS